MSTDQQILFPDRTIAVGTSDGGQPKEVIVREMVWKDALDFLGQLGSFLQKVQDEKGEVRIDIGIITDLIAGTRELVESLIAKATDKDVAWFESLRLSDVMKVIESALDLNLLVLKESGKSIAGRLKESGVGRTATPAAARRSEGPTPSS